jgi:putative ABC transport system permease protein
MSILQHLLEAFESLASNKLRSGLTMLGIVIGVASVISMLAIGNGAQASISNSINSMGTNLLFVSSGARGVRNAKPLTQLDAAAIAELSSVSQVTASLQGRADLTFSGTSSAGTSLVGATSEYSTVRNLPVAEGAFISDTDVSTRANVVVLGSDTANTLFGSTTAGVGEVIRIQGQPFTVVGILVAKGGGGLGSSDDQAIIPLTTAQSRLIKRSPANRVDQIVVQATSAADVATANTDVTALLQSRHHITTGDDDFTILQQADLLSSASSITGVLTIFLGGIGGISLLVGGIGIMNIMLVSVTERTREIGLRKALGAKRVDIMFQFLIESLVLSLVGGAVGVLAASGISNLVGRIAAANSANINPIIGTNAVLLATLFSAAIGIFFGLYPANRAARLEPVEALRTE